MSNCILLLAWIVTVWVQAELATGLFACSGHAPYSRILSGLFKCMLRDTTSTSASSWSPTKESCRFFSVCFAWRKHYYRRQMLSVIAPIYSKIRNLKPKYLAQACSVSLGRSDLNQSVHTRCCLSFSFRFWHCKLNGTKLNQNILSHILTLSFFLFENYKG